MIRLLDPLLRMAWQIGDLGITARLSVRGRSSGKQRSVLVGLLAVDGAWYVGHPNGAVEWTRNLDRAGEASVQVPRQSPVPVAATRLRDGDVRDAVITATAAQQPFPANLLYRAVRRHALAAGVYFLLEPMATDGSVPGTQRPRQPGGLSGAAP